MNREKSISKLRDLMSKQRLVEARNLCLDLTRRYSQDIEIWKARADLHFMLDERDSYGECVQRIIRLSDAIPFHPLLVNMYRVLALNCFKAGRVIEAINAYEHIIAKVPNDADAHAHTGMCHLLLGDFRRGWPEYEWRLKTNASYFPAMTMPRWNGQPLHGKSILVKAEQGHGDTMQFVRYVRDVKAQGGTVVLACQPALRGLLAGCTGADRVVTEGDPAPYYEVETMLLSLPGIFQTTLDTIPADVPYLRAPQEAGAQATTLISRHAGMLRVGLAWAGGKYTMTADRSLKLDQFSDLFGIAGVKFFSLQKDEAAAELKSLPQDTIVDLDSYLGDFADTAAAIEELDLVISVDTAVAHLAGALAKPVWTMIPFAPDWRWMLNREDSPWYPTMRLFRQPAPGDWSSVIARIARQLTAMVQGKSAAGSDLNELKK